MRTPSQIKRALARCRDDHCICDECVFSDGNVKKWRSLMSDALIYIEQLEPMRYGRWISVEERLPDDRGNFITKIHCDNGDWIEVNTFDHMEKEWWHDAVNRTVKATEFVTHWMPLPEAPKEDCNE